jgi:hypothetical protein
MVGIKPCAQIESSLFQWTGRDLRQSERLHAPRPSRDRICRKISGIIVFTPHQVTGVKIRTSRTINHFGSRTEKGA